MGFETVLPSAYYSAVVAATPGDVASARGYAMKVLELKTLLDWEDGGDVKALESVVRNLLSVSPKRGMSVV